MIATDRLMETFQHSTESFEHGYTDLSHTVEIFGLCRECSRFRGPSQNESSGATAEG